MVELMRDMGGCGACCQSDKQRPFVRSQQKTAMADARVVYVVDPRPARPARSARTRGRGEASTVSVRLCKR